MLPFPPYLRLELYSQNLVVVRLQRHYIGLIARQALQRSSFVPLILALSCAAIPSICFVVRRDLLQYLYSLLASICYIGGTT
jgi:hypothetical protein